MVYGGLDHNSIERVLCLLTHLGNCCKQTRQQSGIGPSHFGGNPRKHAAYPPEYNLLSPFAPSVCGWNAVDIASLVPIVVNNVRQNRLVNLGSLSEMTALGRPCSLKTESKKIRAVSGAEAVVVVGAKWTIFVKRSTNTTIAS